ncbi:MAG: ATP-binding cassette domain-containing protein [candidate division Zixibacteria bacterium]|nr:ATP-binding cassette domain-containing protein [candidate division Zixibacteria bacterium]MDD5425999.1 ATP-binding cassette domain-containing protein [candidate division Zixibacteria bacterium]
MYLKLENVRKEYDGKVAVDNLSLDIPKGIIFGIIGPNGAGKTTTIRMIMNIIAPDAGRVIFDGREIDDSFKNHVGYLPEERGLYKKLTLSEVMVYMAELKGTPPAVTRPLLDHWLSKMDLLDYKFRKVEDLSKGMQQKLQFITTILHDPEIIILDELFSGLDPINMELIKNVLLDLKRAGKTILFSTHVMEQAEKLCDNICMISRGKKVIDGSLSSVKAQFGKNTVQINIEGDGAFIKDLPGVKQMTEFNNYIELYLAPGADPSEILKTVVGRVKVNRFEVVEPSLYKIFIDMAKADPTESQRDQGGDHV